MRKARSVIDFPLSCYVLALPEAVHGTAQYSTVDIVPQVLVGGCWG